MCFVFSIKSISQKKTVEMCKILLTLSFVSVVLYSLGFSQSMELKCIYITYFTVIMHNDKHALHSLSHSIWNNTF